MRNLASFLLVSFVGVSVVAALPVAGCSANSGDENDEAVVDGVRLEVLGAYEAINAGGMQSMEGRFVVVNLRLTNKGKNSVPTSSGAYFLETDSGLQYSLAVAAQFLSDQCEDSTQLGPGGSYECSTAFDIPFDEAPAFLVYQLLGNRAPVMTTPCTKCGNACIDPLTDPDHCGGCNNEVGAGNSCVGGMAVCGGMTPDACGGVCTNLNTDPMNCGECGNVIRADQFCSGGEPICDVFEDDCSEVCIDTRADDDNCGACNFQCDPGMCEASRCRTTIGAPSLMTCNELCGSNGYECDGGRALYGAVSVMIECDETPSNSGGLSGIECDCSYGPS